VRLGEGGGSNRLKGDILDVAFLGSVVRIRVQLPDNAGIISLDTFNDPSTPPPVIGTAVTVSFPPSGLMALHEAEASKG
jgi:putative spermidine/putrescine transport system ATP-binding protein